MGKNTQSNKNIKHDIRKSTYENIPYIEHLCFHIGEGGGGK